MWSKKSFLKIHPKLFDWTAAKKKKVVGSGSAFTSYSWFNSCRSTWLSAPSTLLANSSARNNCSTQADIRFNESNHFFFISYCRHEFTNIFFGVKCMCFTFFSLVKDVKVTDRLKS